MLNNIPVKANLQSAAPLTVYRERSLALLADAKQSVKANLPVKANLDRGAVGYFETVLADCTWTLLGDSTCAS